MRSRQRNQQARGAEGLASLECGRKHFERRSWADAFDALKRADSACALGIDDLARLATSAYLIGREDERLIVKADWLRLSADGTLRADRATVTSCTYDEPHVRVVTGDLRIESLEGQGKAYYRLLLKDNRIEMYDWLRIPLPRIDVATDEDLQPLWPTLSIADSARFGTLFGFAFTRPADKAGAPLHAKG